MPSLDVSDPSGGVVERHEGALADGRRRWRIKLASLGAISAVMVGMVALGDVGLATVGVPLGLLAVALPQLLKGPPEQMRSETSRLVGDVLAKRRPLRDLLEPDAPSGERLLHLRSVSDVLEDPDTFMARQAHVWGPVVLGIAVLAMGVGGIVSLMAGDWITAVLFFSMSVAFVVAGLVGWRKDRERYEILAMVEDELQRLQERPHALGLDAADPDWSNRAARHER
jgi:hypothetical protein